MIVQLKRFFEWAEGDADFCQSVDSGNLTSHYRERLKQIGVLFEPEELSLFWKAPDIVKQLRDALFNASQVELSPEINDTVKQYPLIELWFRFISRKQNIYRAIHTKIFRMPHFPKLDAWRLRRISSTRNELGLYGLYLSHPLLAFELGDGCSVGCWFCSFAARKLTQNFDYAEHREFFRQIVQSCVDIFGQEGTNMALLYYGTEPHDNPHYLDFMKDYDELTGGPLCTSTAAGTDAEWIRELIAYYRQGTHPWPRLSVLSKKMLFTIHELYTPEELRDVELLMQMREHPRKKVAGGRILEEQAGLRGREAGQYLDGIVPQGSIACVTGFLINMVNRTIQLVSPCYTSQKWPYGYRIFDERSFNTVEEFDTAIRELIDVNMPDAPFPDMTARFRDDLTFHSTEEGFDLVSPNQVHHVRGQEFYTPLGTLLSGNDLTYNQIYDVMMDRYHINPMVVMAGIKKLFDAGFLDEVYVS